MHDRVKNIRKHLNLTQEEFGNRLGITATAVSRIEKGTRPVTSQMQKAICNVFKVDEDWLRDGLGEMFGDPDAELQAMVDVAMTGQNNIRKAMIIAIASLPEEELAIFEKFLDLIEKRRG